MNLYRHKISKKLYIIEHLKHDIHHLNNNEFAGIYAYPFYRNIGDEITFLNKDSKKCLDFVNAAFDKVASL